MARQQQLVAVWIRRQGRRGPEVQNVMVMTNTAALLMYVLPPCGHVCLQS
jgi:hypothetical protein